MSNTDPTKKPGVNSGAHEAYAVPASYKTSTVLLIHTIKSRNKNIYIKSKR